MTAILALLAVGGGCAVREDSIATRKVTVRDIVLARLGLQASSVVPPWRRVRVRVGDIELEISAIMEDGVWISSDADAFGFDEIEACDGDVHRGSAAIGMEGLRGLPFLCLSQAGQDFVAREWETGFWGSSEAREFLIAEVRRFVVAISDSSFTWPRAVRFLEDVGMAYAQTGSAESKVMIDEVIAAANEACRIEDLGRMSTSWGRVAACGLVSIPGEPPGGGVPQQTYYRLFRGMPKHHLGSLLDYWDSTALTRCSVLGARGEPRLLRLGEVVRTIAFTAAGGECSRDDFMVWTQQPTSERK